MRHSPRLDMTCASDVRRLGTWLLFLSVVTATAGGCGQLLQGTTLHVSDDIGPPQPEGTLILMELLAPVKRDQTLARFRHADLQLAGLTETDVRDGTAVFGTPWK